MSTARRWPVLLICCLALFPVGLNSTALQIAVPALTHDLNPSWNATLWILDSYSLTLAGLLVPAGVCADRFSARSVFTAGLALFAVGSTTGALASSVGAVIAARLISGVGAALLLPSSLSSIRRTFVDGKDRVVALGAWTAAGSTGSMLGPVLSGELIQHVWWGAVFLVNLPLLAVLLATTSRLPGNEVGSVADRGNPRIDVASVVVAVSSMFGIVYSFKAFARLHMSWSLYCIAACSLIGMAWFVRRQQRLAYPVLDLNLFRIRGFTTSTAVVLCSVIAVTGIEVLFAQYFQYVLGASPLASGIRLAPLAAGTIVGSLLGGMVVGRLGHAMSLRIALGVATTAGGVLAGAGHFSDTALVAASFFCIGAGFQVAVNVCSERVLTIAPPSRAGAAGALDSTAFELGSALGVAIPGSIAAMCYAASIDANAAITPTAKSAARQSIAAAADYAAGLPKAQGAALIDAARQAFDSATHICVALSMCLLLVCWGLSTLNAREREGRKPSPNISAHTGQQISTTSPR